MAIDSHSYDGALGAEADFDEVRSVQLGLLDALAKFCEENGLKYYISGGTLLGAVRHGGYIPWDDDIDVNMPRQDCDRLLAMTGGRLGGHMEFGAFGGPISHSVPFIRMYDTRYLLRQENQFGQVRAFSNVSIDIFPIDGLPRSEVVSRAHYFISHSLVVLRRVAYYTRLPSTRNWHYYLRFFAYLPAKLVGWKNWNRLLQKVSRMYPYEPSRPVGVVCCGVHNNEERMAASVYGAGTKLGFEGRSYFAPDGYEEYLTQIYGDYMRLPPEEKRIRRHHCTVFKLEVEK